MIPTQALRHPDPSRRRLNRWLPVSVRWRRHCQFPVASHERASTAADDPASVPVAIETDKNLIVVALHAAGLTVYAVNLRAVVRSRERSSQAGGKFDPGDAIVLANILRIDVPCTERSQRGCPARFCPCRRAA